MFFLLSQGCAAVSIVLSLLLNHFPTKKEMFTCAGIYQFFQIMSYVFLGSVSGVIVRGLSFIRDVIIQQKESNPTLQKYSKYIFLGLMRNKINRI